MSEELVIRGMGDSEIPFESQPQPVEPRVRRTTIAVLDDEVSDLTRRLQDLEDEVAKLRKHAQDIEDPASGVFNVYRERLKVDSRMRASLFHLVRTLQGTENGVLREAVDKWLAL